MPNQLSKESSGYLQQHAHNPVDWYPWQEAAFAQAKRENKLILVSIGYSACHWCHVMAHECFEDPYIADLMNRHYVCIKVDREERPDIDQIYMEVAQMINQRGGWPLNVFCLPDGRPFFAGTYFPPKDQGYGIVPWPQLLMRIASHFQTDPQSLEANAANIVSNLQHSNTPTDTPAMTLTNSDLLQAAQVICKTHDDLWGGFGEAPKFPPAMTLDYLLAVRSTAACDNDNRPLARRIDQVINTTLTKMAQGGLYDQLAGGFSRYAVDRYWRIPHFEKMLYDNALLLDIYSKGWLYYRKPLYRAVVTESIRWLEEVMLSPNGLFYSTVDADSEGKEGYYYLWTPEQITAILGKADSERFCRAYGVTATGNLENGATHLNLQEEAFAQRQDLQALRQKLLAARQQRVAPDIDKKHLTRWNSLMIRAISEAGFYLEQESWLRLAQQALDQLLKQAITDSGTVYSVIYDNPQQLGYLTDYGFLAEACLTLGGKISLLDPPAALRYYKQGQDLVNGVLEHFADKTAPGFYFTSDKHERLISRKKDWLDNACPAGNSSMVHALSALAAITGETRYKESLMTLRSAYTELTQRAPTAISYALAGYTQDAIGVVVIKVQKPEAIKPLAQLLTDRPWRKTYLIPAQPGELRHCYQLCVGSQCYPPTDDAASIVKQL